MHEQRSTLLRLLPFGIAAALVVPTACADESADDETTARDANVDGSDESSLAGPPRPDAGADWVAWATTRGQEIAAARPDLASQLDPDEARPGRDGKLRLRGPWMADADAGPVLLDTFNRAVDVDHRAILADAIAHAEGVPAQAMIDLATKDPAPQVRAQVTPHLWRLRSAEGLEAIAATVADADANVRLGAVVSASRHPQGAEIADAIALRLQDEVPEVRLVATRAMGVVGDTAHLSALEPMLDDVDPQVRLAAVRSVQHIDATAAAQLVAKHGLTADGDQSVARAAEQVTAR